MRRSRWFAATIIVGTLLALVFGSCSSDNNDNQNPPTAGTLNGQVIFYGEWPDSGTVQVSVFDNWDVGLANCAWCPDAANGPPDYYTAALQDPNPNNGDGPDTVSFTIEGITLGTYQAVAVGWRAPTQGDIHCDEPVIGLFGAEPTGPDTLPNAVVFTADESTQNVVLHAYLDRVPVPGCDQRGRIEGTLRLSGPWPPAGLLAMISTYPYTPWNPPLGAPTDYSPQLLEGDTVFYFTPPFGTYYVSIWDYTTNPAEAKWYGALGVNTEANDSRPDPVAIDSTSPLAADLYVYAQAPAPHYIAGHITFNGTRPAEGILALLSTFPYTPEHPPIGAPTDYYIITDANETQYAFTGMAEDTFYVSLWNTLQPPNSVFYGAYGYVSGSDTDPDPLIISATAWGHTNIDITGP